MFTHTLLFFDQISVEGQKASKRYACVLYMDVRIYTKLGLFSYIHILLYSWYRLEKVLFLFHWHPFWEKLKRQMEKNIFSRIKISQFFYLPLKLHSQFDRTMSVIFSGLRKWEESIKQIFRKEMKSWTNKSIGTADWPNSLKNASTLILPLNVRETNIEVEPFCNQSLSKFLR